MRALHRDYGADSSTKEQFPQERPPRRDPRAAILVAACKRRYPRGRSVPDSSSARAIPRAASLGFPFSGKTDFPFVAESSASRGEFPREFQRLFGFVRHRKVSQLLLSNLMCKATRVHLLLEVPDSRLLDGI